jgi:hypothetical protein
MDKTAKARRYRHAHPTVVAAITRRWRLKTYGTTPEGYDQLLQDQKGLCALCQRPERKLYRGQLMRLAVDHDHVTGRVRGLLCHACNTALGLLEDNPATVARLEAYLG